MAPARPRCWPDCPESRTPSSTAWHPRRRPDVALDALGELADVLGEAQLWKALQDDNLRERMILVRGTSERWESSQVCAIRMPWRTCAHSPNVRGPSPTTGTNWRLPATPTLRVAYRRALLGIAARDLDGRTTLAESSAELADLAMATLGGGNF